MAEQIVMQGQVEEWFFGSSFYSRRPAARNSIKGPLGFGTRKTASRLPSEPWTLDGQRLLLAMAEAAEHGNASMPLSK
jgi:hypothetical protein